MDALKPTRRRAKALRQDMSLPEVLLWIQIRKRLQGQLRFRRQHPVGPFILDFYCSEKTLAVEVDGKVHDTGDHPERDRYRDQWLATQGIKTLHIPATEVLNNMDGVISMILLAANQREDPLRPFGPLPPEGEDLRAINLPPLGEVPAKPG